MSAEDHTHGPHAILLFSGAYFDVFDTSPESLARVQFVDVLEGLRAAMRWRGQTIKRITVARHTLAVATLASLHPRAESVGRREVTATALFHDAAEAFLGDVPTPHKRHPAFAEYRAVEAALHAALCRRFGVDPDPGEAVDGIVAEADLAAMCIEAQLYHEVDPLTAWGVPATPWVREVAGRVAVLPQVVSNVYDCSGRRVAAQLRDAFRDLRTE